MEQIVLIFFLLMVVVVKGGAIFALGQRRSALADAQAQDRDAQEKLDALDATKTHLERERKDLEKELGLLENEKNLVVVAIQKHGAKPVPEPTEEEACLPAAPRPAAAAPAPTGEAGEGEPVPSVEGEVAPTPEGADVPPACLPEDARAAARSAEEGAPGAGPAARSGNARRILVVDDNKELRDLLKQALAKLYTVESAADGLEALQVVLKEKRMYDLVICDLNMPNVDGVTFLERLPQKIPAIVISAYLDRPEFTRALQRVRPAAVMGKPFRLSEVKAAIRQVFRQGPEAAPEAPEPAAAAPTPQTGAGQPVPAEGTAGRAPLVAGSRTDGAVAA